MPDREFPGLTASGPAEQHTDTMDILWEPAGEGVRILRVYGNSLKVRIPDRIHGLPVTELGAYCFSASEHLPAGGGRLTRLCNDGDRSTCSGLEDGRAPSFPAVCGDYLREVFLPGSVTTLHNSAFYNCRKLKLLSAGAGLRSIGSDVFMNCRSLDRIDLRASVTEETGLRLILERLITEVEVAFRPEDELRESKNPECVLLFPEYWEWLNEISPAHVFSRSIEGEGFRMRKVFQGHRIDFNKYDQCFPEVLIGESSATVCRIALDRLRWPVSLQLSAEALYVQAVRDRLDAALKLILKNRDMEGLLFLCRRFQPAKGLLLSWMAECTEADWGEGKATLMEEFRQRNSFVDKSFTLDDL